MKRSIWFWLCFVIAIILAIYFSTRVIMTGLGHGTVARVRNISISADQNDKDMSALQIAVALPPGTHTYSVDLDAMNARVAGVPGVKQSSVRRLPNGNIAVKVKLYRAVAQWSDGDSYFPLSADGTIVNKPMTERDPASVVFHGPIPNDITDITNAAHNMVGNINYMEWIENRRWNIITNDGITVLLPEENPTAAIGSLIILNNQHHILSKDIKIIDMRDHARILVK